MKIQQDIEKTYKNEGLATEHGFDEPGKVYPPHRHHKTHLYALNGQVKIRVDEGDWQTIKPGQEFIVQSNQLHEGIVGPEGWEYLAGWDEEEAKQYKGVKH